MAIKVLYSEELIAGRVAELSHDIEKYYKGKDLTVITIMNGGMIFASDLIRRINLPIWIDTFAVSSYCFHSSVGNIKIRSNVKMDVKGRHVLLIDDILDTGKTLAQCKDYFLEKGAIDVKICVLLNKQYKNPAEKKYAHADWACFPAPELFIVGYGLDEDEKYRNLPYIGYVEN